MFDENGFWDSEQFEDILPIQFWRDDVPDQLHLDVLLKAWQDVDVVYTEIIGDPDDFELVTKHVRHNGLTWVVCFNGNMAVEKVQVLS